MAVSISVLMSVYNKEIPEYLDSAMKSIWDDQTTKPNEVVLVKDGPLTKELNSIIDEWETKLSKTLIVVSLDKNVGLAKALNYGLDRCTGELIMRMDTDDISRPFRFGKQLEFMNNNPNIGISGMATSEFYENGNRTENIYPSENDLLKSMLHKASPFAHPTVCYRREIILALGGYPTKFHLCEDIALWFKAAEAGVYFANIPEVGLDFRVMNNFYSRRSYSKSFSELKAYLFGIKKLYGLNWRLLFPFVRFIVRVMPTWLSKFLYQSNIRQQLLRK